ncbi:hypothetical protein GGTG_12159 [Gaeumannomyces tritici R3-111a-1]|uniref:FAD-binding domain-containing protein n=1 Tax=Gaeumannomyces tritici (strain R3-111a-1) TaxID=644352 RepID=J3PF80_GAET3|nr:hypothetical protein GGTG_12159 [Gaeumannomyces tritici R3-111a-1]EJT69982.1 hypothetical protein GGTG_12159 [Gaeumannomyces tritici R3-111a-1]
MKIIGRHSKLLNRLWTRFPISSGAAHQSFEEVSGPTSRGHGQRAVHESQAKAMCSSVRDFRRTQSSPSAQAAPRGCLYPSDDRDARIGVKDDGSNTAVVRANRTLLWRYLETHIPVQYCKMAVGVTQEGETVTVSFADGTSAKGDIVVGADGIHSAMTDYLPPLRKALLPGVEPKTLPLASIIVEVTLSGAAMVRQLQLGRSGYVLRPPRPGADGQAAFMGTNIIHEDGSSGDFHWMIVWPDEEAAVDGGGHAWHATAGREELLARGVAEAKTVDPLRRASCSRRSCSGRFRGEGGVNALIDAVRVGKAIGKIANEGADVKQALGDCVKEMLQRGNRAVTRSEEVTTGPQNIGTEGWTYINRKATKLTPQVISI